MMVTAAAAAVVYVQNKREEKMECRNIICSSTATHTHTHIYIREKMMRERACVCKIALVGNIKLILVRINSH